MIIPLFLLCYLRQFSTSSDQCGVQNFDPSTLQFAVNSEGEAKAPWIAALGIKRNGTDGFIKFIVTCSGVILTPRVIITANHCFYYSGLNPEYIRSGLGSQELTIEDGSITPAQARHHLPGAALASWSQ